MDPIPSFRHSSYIKIYLQNCPHHVETSLNHPKNTLTVTGQVAGQLQEMEKVAQKWARSVVNEYRLGTDLVPTRYGIRHPDQPENSTIL